jgi:hypothetical protein
MSTARTLAHLRRAWPWAAAALALAAVFAAYLRPELALTLATRLWSCF